MSSSWGTGRSCDGSLPRSCEPASNIPTGVHVTATIRPSPPPDSLPDTWPPTDSDSRTVFVLGFERRTDQMDTCAEDKPPIQNVAHIGKVSRRGARRRAVFSHLICLRMASASLPPSHAPSVPPTLPSVPSRSPPETNWRHPKTLPLQRGLIRGAAAPTDPDRGSRPGGQRVGAQLTRRPALKRNYRPAVRVRRRSSPGRPALKRTTGRPLGYGGAADQTELKQNYQPAVRVRRRN